MITGQKINKNTMARLMSWKPLTEAEKVTLGFYKLQQIANQRQQQGNRPTVTMAPVNDQIHRYGFAQPNQHEKSIMEKYSFKGAIPGTDHKRNQERPFQFVGGERPQTKEEKFNFVGTRKSSIEEFFI